MFARSLRLLVQWLSPSAHRAWPAARKRARRFRPAVQLLEDRTLPTTVFWTNPAGGDWGTPGNWSTGAVPGPDDDAVIDVPGEPLVTHAGGTDSVRSLTSQERIVLSGGSLSLAAPSVIESDLIFTGGTLTGPGDLAVGGALVWTGGAMTGSGRTRADGVLLLSGSDAKTLDGRALDNAGTFRKVSGSGTSNVGMLFDNTGTVEVQTGILKFYRRGAPAAASSGRQPGRPWLLVRAFTPSPPPPTSPAPAA